MHGYYRLEEPILHLLWCLVEMFFGYNFPKLEPVWMECGLQVRGHGVHSHKENGEIAPGVLPHGAKSFFLFLVIKATRPFGHLSCTDFDHF